MKKPIAALAAATALVALPSAAAAAKSAQFRVTVEGVQTDKWSSVYHSSGRCDPSGEAHGTEVVRFATLKATKATVIDKPFLHFGATYELPRRVRAKVTRHGVQTVEPTPPECGGTGGGSGGGPKPDCGTKRLPWDLSARYASDGARSGIELSRRGGSYDDPFANCPVGGIAFPQILTTNTKGQTIRGKVKPSWFFDKRYDTIVVHGAGKRVEKKPMIGIDRTATVEWTITFERVEKE
jgi:hypothetical protein